MESYKTYKKVGHHMGAGGVGGGKYMGRSPMEIRAQHEVNRRKIHNSAKHVTNQPLTEEQKRSALRDRTWWNLWQFWR